MMTVDLKLHIRIIISAAVVGLMMLAAEILGEYDMVFPEVAALALGLLVSEKIPWRTTPVRMFSLMAVSAFLGYGMACLTAVPIYPKIIVAFLLCGIMLYFAKSTFLPVISAGILPIITGAQSVIYPLSVIILTGAIILLQMMMNKFALRSNDNYELCSLHIAEEKGRFLFLLAGVMVVSALAVGFNLLYIIAPPLIVAFAESMDKDSNAVKSPVLTVLSIIACALIGTCSRLLLCAVLELSLAVGAAVSVAAAVYLLVMFGRLFPPAAAIAVLPFIIPESALAAYPFEVAVGAAVFMGAAYIVGASAPNPDQRLRLWKPQGSKLP